MEYLSVSEAHFCTPAAKLTGAMINLVLQFLCRELVHERGFHFFPRTDAWAGTAGRLLPILFQTRYNAGRLIVAISC